MPQTTVQKTEAIRFGSCRVEIGATIGALVDIGVLRDAVFEYTFDKVQLDSDNGGVINRGTRNERARMKGNAMEFNLARVADFYDGVLTKTVVAAAPVAVTDEEQVLTGLAWNRLDNKNGDGTEVSTIVVTNTAGTVTYKRDCDYVIAQDADGWTTIARANPTVIEGPTAVCAVTGTDSYFLSAGSWNVQPAVGDHITVAGFTEAANNGVKTVTGVTADTITVAEVLTNEVEGDTVTITRGGITTGQTVEVDYSYTPNASVTIKGGGKKTLTAKVVRFTNTDAAGNDITCTVYSATSATGIVINFPSDDDVDPWLVPFEMEGVPDTSRTEGDQLFVIVDEQAP